MWATVLGGLIKGGTTAPKQIEIKDDSSDNIALYGFAAVALIILAVIFIKSFK